MIDSPERTTEQTNPIPDPRPAKKVRSKQEIMNALVVKLKGDNQKAADTSKTQHDIEAANIITKGHKKALDITRGDTATTDTKPASPNTPPPTINTKE